jgi:hypothetical protein
MNFKRLLHSDFGVILISVLLGLGIATLFRKVCTDKNCIQFKGPIIGEVADKIYKHNDKCYKYKVNSTACNSAKKIVEIRSPAEEEVMIQHQQI